MKIFLFAFCLTGWLLVLASCHPSQRKSFTHTQATNQIQAMEDAFAAAKKAKDISGLISYYSDDAVSFNQNGEPSVGKEAIKMRLKKRMTDDTTGNYSVYKLIDLFEEGNMLVETGAYTTYQPSGDVVKKGYYMSYFQKRNGKYVCVRDISVSSRPAIAD